MSGIELKDSWTDLWAKGSALFLEHRAELELHEPRVPYSMDFERVGQLEELGVVQVVAGQRNGVYVGYCIFFISPSLESRGIQVGSQGPWFVTAEHRGGALGLRLWRESIERLRERGVRHVLAHAYDKSDPRLGAFFEHQGAVPYAKVWSMVI